MQIPLSLYIHIPWCVKKCPYCDFNSHHAREALPEIEYVNCLIKDLEQELPSIWGRKIQTIFIGGGTPSLFSPAALDHLFKQIHARLSYSPDIEITMEANPGTVEQQKFKEFRDVGINRLSLGIQSFQDEKLQLLGRIHNGAEARTAIEIAKLAGFSNLNLDIMFGLPTQTLQDAMHDLNCAISLEPTHFSWYQLTIEPNTHFFQFPPKLPEDDHIWEIQNQGQAILKNLNFHQYEISAYSRQGFQCQHNRNYWEFGDYIGIGAGAHGKITNFSSGTIKRKWKIKHPKQYLKAEQFSAGEKIISPNELPLEFMLNTLRLNEPVPTSLFEERTLLPFNSVKEKLKQAEDLGFIILDKESFTTTQHGKLFLNDLLQLFSWISA